MWEESWSSEPLVGYRQTKITSIGGRALGWTAGWGLTIRLFWRCTESLKGWRWGWGCVALWCEPRCRLFYLSIFIIVLGRRGEKYTINRKVWHEVYFFRALIWWDQLRHQSHVIMTNTVTQEHHLLQNTELMIHIGFGFRCISSEHQKVYLLVWRSSFMFWQTG